MVQPQVLSKLVMKLMAKTAGERYQSSYGIRADLEECLRQLNFSGTIHNFPLATQDIIHKFKRNFDLQTNILKTSV